MVLRDTLLFVTVHRNECPKMLNKDTIICDYTIDLSLRPKATKNYW